MSLHDPVLDLVRDAWTQCRRHGREMLQIYLKNDSLLLAPQGPRVEYLEDRRLQVVLTLGPVLGQRPLRNGKMNHLPWVPLC